MVKTETKLQQFWSAADVVLSWLFTIMYRTTSTHPSGWTPVEWLASGF